MVRAKERRVKSLGGRPASPGDEGGLRPDRLVV